MDIVRTAPIRLVLLDDDDASRKRLASRLAGEPRLSIVADVPDSDRALQLSLELRPDAVLVELRRQDKRGLEAIVAFSSIVQQNRPAIIVYLETIHRADWLAARVAGADDVLLKEMPPRSVARELARIVNRVRQDACTRRS